MLHFDYNLTKTRILGKKNPKTALGLSLVLLQNPMDNRSPGSNELTITYFISIVEAIANVNN